MSDGLFLFVLVGVCHYDARPGVQAACFWFCTALQIVGLGVLALVVWTYTRGVLAVAR